MLRVRCGSSFDRLHAQPAGSSFVGSTGCKLGSSTNSTALPHHSLTRHAGRDCRATEIAVFLNELVRRVSLTIALINDKEHPRQRRDRTAWSCHNLPAFSSLASQIALVACSQAGFRTGTGLFS